MATLGKSGEDVMRFGVDDETLVERNGGEMGGTLIVVDCEAPFGVGAPSVGLAP